MGAAPGACARDVRFSLPKGEQAHGAYSVSATAAVTLSWPLSSVMGRPKRVVFFLRAPGVAVCVWASRHTLFNFISLIPSITSKPPLSVTASRRATVTAVKDHPHGD